MMSSSSDECRISCWRPLCLIEHHVVVQFFTLKSLSARDIKAELEGVYDYEALFLSDGGEVAQSFCRQEDQLWRWPKVWSSHKAISASPCKVLSRKDPLLRAPACETNFPRSHNVPAHPARPAWVQKMLFLVDSVFNHWERCPIWNCIFRGASSSRATCQRDEYRQFMSRDESLFCSDCAYDLAWAPSEVALLTSMSSKI
jgi:hypothetical protein